MLRSWAWNPGTLTAWVKDLPCLPVIHLRSSSHVIVGFRCGCWTSTVFQKLKLQNENQMDQTVLNTATFLSQGGYGLKIISIYFNCFFPIFWLSLDDGMNNGPLTKPKAHLSNQLIIRRFRSMTSPIRRHCDVLSLNLSWRQINQNLKETCNNMFTNVHQNYEGQSSHRLHLQQTKSLKTFFFFSGLYWTFFCCKFQVIFSTRLFQGDFFEIFWDFLFFGDFGAVVWTGHHNTRSCSINKTTQQNYPTKIFPAFENKTRLT